jgi:hypothetical protein
LESCTGKTEKIERLYQEKRADQCGGEQSRHSAVHCSLVVLAAGQDNAGVAFAISHEYPDSAFQIRMMIPLYYKLN